MVIANKFKVQVNSQLKIRTVQKYFILAETFKIVEFEEIFLLT